VSQTDQMSPERAKKEVPGGDAAKPTEIPKRGWLQVVKRGWAEAKADQVPLLGAGVAFYAFLALFPSLIAIVLIYGLVADPAQIANQVGQLSGALPEDARRIITDQLQFVSTRETGAGIGLVVAILLALWGASGGMSNLMTAISTAYDEEEKRSFIKKRLLALGLTLGAIVFMVIMLALVAVFPALADLIDNDVVRILLTIVRWVLIAVLVSAALAVLYRVSPDRDAPKMRWVSVGAVVATVLWLLASAGFSLYVANFGSYAKTYGAIAGIVVMLMWLWITAYAILLGAEINAESEQQTVRDTTKGPDAPLGERDAVKADSLPSVEEGETDPKAQRQTQEKNR
jgi:membrane protein